MTNPSMFRSAAVLAALGATAAFGGCEPTQQTNDEPSAEPGGAAGDAAGGSSPSEGGRAGANTGPEKPGLGGAGGRPGCLPGNLSTCSAEVVDSVSLPPLDIYVMFDQSGSMLNPVGEDSTRMEEVRSAVRSFLQDPRSAGMHVGIGYFGKFPIGEESCDPAHHTTSDVGMGLLPAHLDAMMDSLEAAEPTGETPTPAAIEGACTYAKSWQAAHRDRVTMILLVTDGEPQTPTSQACEPTIEEAEGAAIACLEGDPSIQTYVLGVGPSLDNLHRIAAAGGTEQAFLVEDGRVPVFEGLTAVREASPVCKVALPDDGSVDPAKLDLSYTDASCAPTALVHLDDASACETTENGWYFDAADAPTAIHLCGDTCATLREPGAELHLLNGCGGR